MDYGEVTRLKYIKFPIAVWKKADKISFMIDMAASLALIKGTMEIVTSLRNNISDAKFQKELISIYNSLIDLKGELLSLQTQNAKLSDVNRKLEQQLAEYDNWEKTKSRYELKEFSPGIFVYSLKKEFHGEEIPHYLCPACMQKRQKGIMSKESIDDYDYKCVICKNGFSTFQNPLPFMID